MLLVFHLFGPAYVLLLSFIIRENSLIANVHRSTKKNDQFAYFFLRNKNIAILPHFNISPSSWSIVIAANVVVTAENTLQITLRNTAELAVLDRIKIRARSDYVDRSSYVECRRNGVHVVETPKTISKIVLGHAAELTDVGQIKIRVHFGYVDQANGTVSA